MGLRTPKPKIIPKKSTFNRTTMTSGQSYQEASKSLEAKKAAEAQAAAKKAADMEKAFKIKQADNIAKQAQAQQKVQEQRSAEATSQQAQSREQQQGFINQLKEQSAGSNNTAAQLTLQKGADRAEAQRRAIAASQANGTAAGIRAQQRAGASAQAQQNQNSQTLRVQEQLAARQQLVPALQAQGQADIGQQQFAASQGTNLLGQQLTLGQQEQQAAAAGQTLKVEQDLSKQGARLTKDIANTNAQNAQSKAIGSMVGGVAGFALSGGSPMGATVGSQVGQSLTYNKGGKVSMSENTKNTKNTKNVKTDKKMSKEEMFGYKKALESNTSTNQDEQYAKGGEVVKFTGDTPPTLSKKAQYKQASTIQDSKKFQDTTKARTNEYTAQEAQKYQDAQQSRAAQSSLVDKLKQQQLGAGPSLANVNLKAQSDTSLAQQLGAANSGKKPVNPAQLQQALMQSQQQQASNIADQASQLAAQESQQAGNTGLSAVQGLRSNDISQQQFSQQLINQQMLQEATTRQAEQQAAQAKLSLGIDEETSLRAMAAQKSAATAGGGKFLGLFSEGGKVPGTEIVNGDNVKNDIIDAKLSPGEIVIPKTVVNKGEKAMHGFIKGIQQMSANEKASKGKKNYNEGGVAKEEDSNDKKDDNAKKDESRTDQLGTAALESGAKIYGQLQKDKKDIRDKEAKSAEDDFKSALSRIRNRRNYASGGKVESGSYGMILKARNDLDKKLKELDNKK
jgi:hypothetical protein